MFVVLFVTQILGYWFHNLTIMTDIASNRNNDMLSHDGHLYWLDKLIANETKKSWRCATRLANGKRCQGRVYTDLDNRSVTVVSAHGAHTGDAARVEVARAITTMKRRAVDTQEIPTQIRTNTLQNMTLAARARLPDKAATTKRIQRVRQVVNAAPAQPVDRASIEIPESFQEYEHNPGQVENFLLSDSGVGDQDRILIFGRASSQQWISHVQKIYVDGTFSLAPSLFAQIFVLMAERNGFVIPILYALLPNKQQVTYTRMLQMIRTAWPEFNPEIVSLDYEIAIVNAFNGVFPGIQLHGCLFHLVQNVKRRLSSEGLMQRYVNDADFALQARMIPALAFVPIDNLVDAVDSLRGIIDDDTEEPEPPIDADLMPILDSFESTYIGRLVRLNRRSRPTFSPEMWSCYERTLNDEARTNNYAEAAHRRLQAEFGVDHPTLWKFIDGLRTVQKSTDQIYEEFVRGDSPPRKRNKYQQMDARILRIVESFESREIVEYLRGIASNFMMD